MQNDKKKDVVYLYLSSKWRKGCLDRTCFIFFFLGIDMYHAVPFKIALFLNRDSPIPITWIVSTKVHVELPLQNNTALWSQVARLLIFSSKLLWNIRSFICCVLFFQVKGKNSSGSFGLFQNQACTRHPFELMKTDKGVSNSKCFTHR